jgi:hypothetical protein
MKHVYVVLEENHSMTCKVTTAEVWISAASVFSSLTKHLGKRNVHAKWIANTHTHTHTHTEWRSVCHLSNSEKIYAYFQQYSATALTTNSSMYCLQTFLVTKNKQGIVASLLAGPEPIHFLFVRHVKGSEYSNSPHSERKHSEYVFSFTNSTPAHTAQCTFLVWCMCMSASERKLFIAPSFNRLAKSTMSTAIHWTKCVDSNSLQWLPHYLPSRKTVWEQNEASCQKSLYYNLTTLHTSIVIKKQNGEETQTL